MTAYVKERPLSRVKVPVDDALMVRRRLQVAEPPCVKGRIVGAVKGRLGPVKGRLGPVKGKGVGPVTEKVGMKGMAEAVVKVRQGGKGRVDC